MTVAIPRTGRRTLSHRLLAFALLGAGAAPLLSAGCSCSPEESETPGSSGGGGSGGAVPAQGGGGADGVGGNIFNLSDLVSVALDPPSAALTSTNGSRPEQVFRVIGTYEDGSTQVLDSATFSLDALSLGEVDANSGVFSANGIIGGAGTVSATVPDPEGSGRLSATATISVKLDFTLFGEGAPMDAGTHFEGALTPDAARAPGIVYPLDGAVMPQNVYPADVQWLNGAAGDIFRVILEKPSAVARAYVLHSGPSFRNDWLVDTQVWRSLAQSDPDAPMAITVDRWESATGQTIASDTTVSMRFAKAALTGSVYYWDINAVRIKRIDDGTGTSVSFMPTPPRSPATGENCVGCHSVSNSGRYMAGRLGGGDNIGGIFDLSQDLTLDPPPTVYPLNGASIRWWFSSWSPDDTRMVVSTNEGSTRAMFIYDPFAGAVVPIQGTLPTRATHPVWSPDGRSIAYVANANDWGGAFTVGSIGVLPVTGPDTFGPGTVILDGAALAGETPGGQANSYPTWTPDSQRLAFAHGTGSRSDLPDGRQSALYIMNADGSGVVRLNAACGGPTSTEDFQPRFSPFDSGGYFWLSFLSRRDYGNTQAGTRGTYRQQIWVTAIRKDAAPGEDPSAVAFWLPGQATSSKNISAFWAPRACRVDGESCTVSSECCGEDCRPDANGALVCTPPPPERCRERNETCTTSADCCDARECINNVCIDPIPN